MCFLFFWLLKIASVNLLSEYFCPYSLRLSQATHDEIVEIYRAAM